MKAVAVIFSVVFLAGIFSALELFVSNASIGGQVYVLAQEENGSLFEGPGEVASPLGRAFPVEIKNGQAEFPAGEVGEWEVRIGSVKRKASVFDEGAHARSVDGGGNPFGLFFAAIGLVFALGVCALFVAAKKALEDKGREESAKPAQKRRLEKESGG